MIHLATQGRSLRNQPTANRHSPNTSSESTGTDRMALKDAGVSLKASVTSTPSRSRKAKKLLRADSTRASERLEALGLTVVALEPKTHADVRRVLGVVSDLLGVPRAQGSDRLWRVIDAGVQAAAQSLPPKAKNARVYFEVSRGPYAAGESSFIGESLARLGVRNVVPASLGPFPRLNPEFVVRANPDIIMIGNRSMQAMVPYPGWASMRAIRENRLCVFGPGDSDVVVRPGPRMAEAARIMARCLAEKAPPESPAAPSPSGGRTQWPGKASSTGALSWAAPVASADSSASVAVN